jgi:hypothetical protein
MVNSVCQLIEKVKEKELEVKEKELEVKEKELEVKEKEEKLIHIDEDKRRVTLESLENLQKNTELMVNSVCQLIEKVKEKELEVKEKEEKLILIDEDKRRAAYALNLCTVSVSQIIDYDDENILEQEYETILNNLNLEHMPKDEALLNVLKQLLDTVTFFRIQEGDKIFIEKEYQHKVKNAIWSGIPNFGLILTSGNPITIAVSLASQVGIGYMNYRKAKAENNLEKEQKEWQLQRAAIEQFNALRRELFDASWRLADRYGFPDEYRLTERQITQYNKILMDTDDIRKYERLESVKGYFVAYPPFWYYFGHAANSIAVNAIRDKDNDLYSKYKSLAIEHFDKYMEINKYVLLREDQITSSCALEYIDLLDASTDQIKIRELLDCALKMSGRECDILQFCAISYLKINDIASAVELLKYLVNENYNAVTNAQLLSSIYVNGYLANNNDAFAIEYKMLQKTVTDELLFPCPQDSHVKFGELKLNFISKQRDVLNQKYAYVIKKYYEKCTVIFNKLIPVPYEDKLYSDSFFLDENREERYNQYKKIFSNKNKADDYVYRLVNSNFSLGYLEILNEMVNEIEGILVDEPENKIDIIQQLVESIETKIGEKRNTINQLQEKMNEDFGSEEFEMLFNLSFDVFTTEFYKKLLDVINNHIKQLKSMSDFSKEETMLREFCIKQGIPEFKMTMNMYNQSFDEVTSNKNHFSSKLLGEEASEWSDMVMMARRMVKCIDDAIKNIFIFDEKNKQKQNSHIYTKWNKKLKGYFDEYLKKGNKKYYNGNKELGQKIIAVLVDESKAFGNVDLIFTTEGIIVDKFFVGFFNNPTIISYKEIMFENNNNALILRDEKYKNKEVEMEFLFNLTQELSEIVSGSDVGANPSERD